MGEVGEAKGEVGALTKGEVGALTKGEVGVARKRRGTPGKRLKPKPQTPGTRVNPTPYTPNPTTPAALLVSSLNPKPQTALELKP